MTNYRTVAQALMMSALVFAFGNVAKSDIIYELEPVVVTGDLLQGSLDRLPASVSIFGSADVDATGTGHLENLLGRMPNLNWAGGTSRPRFFQIRGIGETSQFGNEIPASSVGFIIDGIDFTGIGGVSSLFDVAQVELLRGPQAAAFGANALAGMILIETTAPSPDTKGTAELSLGDNDLISFGAALGGPIGNNRTSTLSYRISIQQYQDNGYRNNSFLKRDDTNSRDEQSARLKLNWTPSDSFELDFTLVYFDFDNGYDAWSLTNNSFLTSTDEPGEDSQKTIGAGIKATWRLSENLEIRYLGSATESDLLYSFDWDWSNVTELMELYGPEVYWGTDVTDRQRRVWSHDLRLSSPVEVASDRSAEWAAGLYYRDFEEEQAYYGISSQYRTETTAIYGQTRIELAPDYSLTLSARVEDFRIDYTDDLDTNLGGKEQPWGGKIALDYSLSARSNLYASVDRGYKAGGVNLDNEVPVESRVYGTETLWNYEMGWRGVLLESRLRAQLTAFFMDRKDIQVDSSIQLGDGNTFALFKDNAASGHNYGIEVEIEWKLAEHLQLFANLGLLEAKFDAYRFIDPNDGITEVILSGTSQGYAPGHTYAVGLDYRADNGFFANARIEGKDQYLFDIKNAQSLSSHNLVHVHAGYDSGPWRVTLWINNLLNENYDAHGFFFANEPPFYDAPKKWTSQGAPRQIGLTMRRSF